MEVITYDVSQVDPTQLCYQCLRCRTTMWSDYEPLNCVYCGWYELTVAVDCVRHFPEQRTIFDHDSEASHL